MFRKIGITMLACMILLVCWIFVPGMQIRARAESSLSTSSDPVSLPKAFNADRVTFNMTADQAIQWVKERKGKKVGQGQCVSLVAAYIRFLGSEPFSCDYASQYSTFDPPAGFDKLQGVQPVKGDILIWTTKKNGQPGYAPGHVAIYESDYSGWHQNVSGNQTVRNITEYYYDLHEWDTTISYWGVYRPRFQPLDTGETGKYFVVTANPGYVRNGNYDTTDVIYTAQPDESFRIIGSAINSFNNKWYWVEYASWQFGWIYSERGKVYAPKTLTLINVNKNYVVPLHNGYLGEAAVTATASQGQAVTVIGEKINKYGNLWYHVIWNGGQYWLWSEYCNPGATSKDLIVGDTVYHGIDDPEMGMTVSGGTSDGTTFDVNGAASYTIPSGATTIGGLQNAGSLKAITIPTSVTSIGANAFNGCTALTKVNYAGTTAGWNAISKSSTGNAPLLSATVVCQGDSNGASFSSVTAEPATTNAVLRATVKVNSGSGTFTGSGIRLYQGNTLVASKDEKHSYYRSASGNSSYNIWYDITGELGKTLSPGITYHYQFYSVFNGTEIWSGDQSFTTAGKSSLDFAFTLEEVTETSVKFTFKANSYNNTWGIYSEFGHTITDLTEGRVHDTYVNTTDKNLGSNSGKKAQWFAINGWTPYRNLTPGHTYGIKFSFVFNGVRYDSDTYTFTTLDNTAPVIKSLSATDVTANGFTVTSRVTDNSAVAKVQFAVWTEKNGQDDLVWYDGQQSGSYWSATVNTNEGHNGENNCNYLMQAYAWDKNGNRTVSDTLTQYVDATPPVITGAEVVTVTKTGYQVRFKASDDRQLYTVSAKSFLTADQVLKTTRTQSGEWMLLDVDTADVMEGLALPACFTTEITVGDKAGNTATETVFVLLEGKEEEPEKNLDDEEKKPVVPGDVNRDGVVDGRDSIRLMKYLAGETDPETGEEYVISRKNADLNGDDEVNELDLLRLMKMLAETNGK